MKLARWRVWENSVECVHRNILVSRGEEVMWGLDSRREWPEGEGIVAKIMPHQSQPCRTQDQFIRPELEPNSGAKESQHRRRCKQRQTHRLGEAGSLPPVQAAKGSASLFALLACSPPYNSYAGALVKKA